MSIFHPKDPSRLLDGAVTVMMAFNAGWSVTTRTYLLVGSEWWVIAWYALIALYFVGCWTSGAGPPRSTYVRMLSRWSLLFGCIACLALPVLQPGAMPRYGPVTDNEWLALGICFIGRLSRSPPPDSPQQLYF